jgi:hypothetical protein
MPIMMKERWVARRLTHSWRMRSPVSAARRFEVAEATYRAAVARWPAARITLRQGIRAVHEQALVIGTALPRI